MPSGVDCAQTLKVRCVLRPNLTFCSDGPPPKGESGAQSRLPVGNPEVAVGGVLGSQGPNLCRG